MSQPASAEPGDGYALVLTVDGSALSARVLEQVVTIRVDRALGIVGRATVKLWDDEFSLSSSQTFSLGKQVEVATYGAGSEKLFSGTITSVGMEVSARGRELVVVADDPGTALMRPMKTKGADKVKPSDLVQEIAKDAGLSVDIEADCVGGAQPYLLKVGSGLAYLETLCARTGAVWWFEGEKLMVRGPEQPIRTTSLTFEKELVSFNVKATAAAQSGYEVRGWDVAQKATVVGRAEVRRAGMEEESHFVGGAAGRPGDRSTSGRSVLVRDAAPLTQTEAEKIAKVRAAELARSAVVVRGTCLGVAKLGPNVDVKIANVGPGSGTYRVTHVEHVYSASGLVTHFTAGPLRRAGLVDTLGPRPDDAGMRVDHVLVALVTNNKDPDNMGRVRVKIPDLSDEVESQWARVAMVGAGGTESKGRGVFFLPEVNDEVLVTFEAGDTRRPIVLGGLYGGKASSPLTASQAVANGDVSKRQIVSRLGHTIELADGTQPAEKHVQLKTADGQLLRVGSDKVTIDSAGKPIEILGASGSSIKVDASGAVTIEGSKIVLKSASGPVQVEGVQVNVKGSGPVTVESQSQMTVKGGAATSVSSSGILEVKGTMVKIN
ncbi:phage baseplate assembly protein V [Nocardioides flavescens]|uniref:Gp5/Type VI secretion system Vgr protein OB-fold domain-containing protein n=1 Tax=Nocardioides flavescens TaxID=2691959 RepID=A0A6L7ENA9_9ACTN|nr:hypothetical protein [Nocardioides flavescens]